MAKRVPKSPTPDPTPPAAPVHFGPPAPVSRETGFPHLCRVLRKTGQEGFHAICEEAALRIEQLEELTGPDRPRRRSWMSP